MRNNFYSICVLFYVILVTFSVRESIGSLSGNRRVIPFKDLDLYYFSIKTDAQEILIWWNEAISDFKIKMEMSTTGKDKIWNDVPLDKTRRDVFIKDFKPGVKTEIRIYVSRTIGNVNEYAEIYFNVTPKHDIPQPPKDLTLDQVTDKQIYLKWTDSQWDTTSYTVFYHDEFQFYSKVVVGRKDTTITGLKPGTHYVFYVVAEDGFGSSAYSHPQETTTHLTETGPVTNVIWITGHDYVEISWMKPSAENDVPFLYFLYIKLNETSKYCQKIHYAECSDCSGITIANYKRLWKKLKCADSEYYIGKFSQFNRNAKKFKVTFNGLSASTSYNLAIFPVNLAVTNLKIEIEIKTFDYKSGIVSRLQKIARLDGDLEIKWRKPTTSNGQIVAYVVRIISSDGKCVKLSLFNCQNCERTGNSTVDGIQRELRKLDRSCSEFTDRRDLDPQRDAFHFFVKDFIPCESYGINVIPVNGYGLGSFAKALVIMKPLIKQKIENSSIILTTVNPTTIKIFWPKQTGKCEYSYDVTCQNFKSSKYDTQIRISKTHTTMPNLGNMDDMKCKVRVIAAPTQTADPSKEGQWSDWKYFKKREAVKSTQSPGTYSYLWILAVVVVGMVVALVALLRRRQIKKRKPESLVVFIRDCEENPADNSRESAANIPLTPSPVSVCQFETYVLRLQANACELYLAQFQQLYQDSLKQKQNKKLTFNAGNIDANARKNRYTNILPYDQTRVRLNTEDDYINANFVEGVKSKQEYIAAQGPSDSTVTDFWRMVCEQNADMIVMLTSLEENGKTKCTQYWPSEPKDVIFGQKDPILISWISFEELNGAAITMLDVTYKLTTRKVTHIHMTRWPDFNCPQFDFQQIMCTYQGLKTPGSRAPIVVHCSAGIGPTGTFICTDILMNRLESGSQKIDIFGTILNLRAYRMGLVQTERQFVFLHEFMMHFLRERNMLASEVAQDGRNLSGDDHIYLNTMDVL